MAQPRVGPALEHGSILGVQESVEQIGQSQQGIEELGTSLFKQNCTRRAQVTW